MKPIIDDLYTPFSSEHGLTTVDMHVKCFDESSMKCRALPEGAYVSLKALFGYPLFMTTAGVPPILYTSSGLFGAVPLTAFDDYTARAIQKIPWLDFLAPPANDEEGDSL